jgi:hypothetical protein
MTTLDSPCQLDSLAISPTLYDFLTHHLMTLPFNDDASAANAVWSSTGTRLYALDATDRFNDIPGMDRVKRFQLIHLQEILINTPDQHVLLLAVTQDDGGGTYLLFPKATGCTTLAALGRQAHD